MGKFLTKNQRAESNLTIKKKFTNVFVKNFGEVLNDDQLKELFSKFGEITSVIIARHPDGKSKGFGFCNFKDVESAEHVCTEFFYDQDFINLNYYFFK